MADPTKQQMRICKEPEIIEKIIIPQTKNILYESADRLLLGRDFLKRTHFGIVISDSWSCVGVGEFIITILGIKSFNLKEIIKVNCDFNFWIDGKYFTDVKSTYFNNKVKILNLDELILTINNEFCVKCEKRISSCNCNKDTPSTNKNEYKPIPLSEFEINDNFRKGFDGEVYDSTEFFVSPVKEEVKPNTPNLEKYMPVIMGICHTYKMKLDVAKNLATSILIAYPDITEERLALEMIKNSK